MGGCSRDFFMQPVGDSFTSPSPEELAREHPADALRADLDRLVALHEEACPDPYMRSSKESIRATCERLKASITGPLTRSRFVPLVMELQAAYGVDHICHSVSRDDLLPAIKAGERLLPFRAAPSDDHGTTVLAVGAVSGAETQLEPGDLVRRVGPLSAADLVARMRALVPAESERFQGMRMRQSFRALAWAAGVTLPAEIELTRGAERMVVTVTGVADDTRKDERIATPATATASAAAPTSDVLAESGAYRCTLLEGGIAYIDFPTMQAALRPAWNAFLVDAINAANARGAIGLVVDIRRNGGGDSQLGDDLFAHLTDRPYRMAGGLSWRKSDAGYDSLSRSVKPQWRWLLPVLMPFVAEEYQSIKNGDDLVASSEPEAVTRIAPAFDGPTALLIGEGTFSSAMMVADAARTYDLMTTIGQPTGGLPTSLGELGFTELPESRIIVQFCQKKFLRASGDPADNGPVVPHIAVVDSPTARAAGDDATLRRAVEELKARHAASSTS